MSNFSKLQKKVYNLFDEKLKGRLQFHETSYSYGEFFAAALRFDLDGKLIYNWPHDIKNNLSYNGQSNIPGYFYFVDIKLLNNSIDEYVNCPKEELFIKEINDFNTGLIDIIRATDRRIGKRQANKYLVSIIQDDMRSNAIMEILKIRGFVNENKKQD